jgi:hyaluronoglucosaminidase
MELLVSINPVEDSDGRFVFSDPDGERRLLAFAALLRQEAGVRQIALSFDDQPTELHELSDIFKYGFGAAAAHLDLARRLAAGLPRDVAPWLCASAYCDAHLGDGTRPYVKTLLEGIPSLPPEVGIVWTGPQVLSPTITRADIAASRDRLSGRKILLYDNFPVNENDENDAMALVLGALRGREAGIRDVTTAYLACPERPLAASRLSLLTIAEFLDDPAAYDPDAAAARAVARLAGADPETKDALTTQQLEWGGFIEGRNYWPRDALNPEAAANRLNDPAFVDSFTWTAARYPDRMRALSRLADTAFRDDLLETMRRRLAIARVMPLTIDYLARVRSGRLGADEVLKRIDAERRGLAGDADARRVVDRFLDAAQIPPLQAAP